MDREVLCTGITTIRVRQRNQQMLRNFRHVIFEPADQMYPRARDTMMRVGFLFSGLRIFALDQFIQRIIATVTGQQIEQSARFIVAVFHERIEADGSA